MKGPRCRPPEGKFGFGLSFELAKTLKESDKEGDEGMELSSLEITSDSPPTMLFTTESEIE